MKKFSRNKTLLILATCVSLFAVAVGAISTAAWFQIDSQSPEFNSTSADTNLTIDNENVTGYKINPTLGVDGFPDYTSNTVAHKKGSTYETENSNQAGADTVFDVPSDGLGYYLIKKNPSDTYKYNYAGGGTYAWKFKELNNNDINYLTIDASTLGTITPSDSFIIRKYSYNSAEYKTVNVKVDITKDNNDDSSFGIDNTTYEITPSVSGSYNIWFNKSTKKVSFDTPLEIANKNLAAPAGRIRSPKTPFNAGGATAEAKTVYILYNSSLWDAGARIFLCEKNTATEHWTEFTSSGYRFNDNVIYKATASEVSSISKYCILRRDPSNNSTWNYSTDYTDFSSSKNYLTFSSFSGSNINFSKSQFSSVVYDGWTIVGTSSNNESSFYGKSFTVAGAIRLDASEGNNYGKIVVDLRPGDKFKIAYLKNNSISEWYGFHYDNSTTERIEVYGGSVSSYFESDNSDNCTVKNDVSLHCTIYFTNNNDDKHINVNITSSLIIKASKFNFAGTIENDYSYEVCSKSVILGSTVTVSELNTLINSEGNVPTNYSRVGTSIYSNYDCAAGHAYSSSFTASSNPMTVYIKVQENAISITLKAYFSDTSSGADGSIDNTRTKTLNTQFGANSEVSASDLYTLWTTAVGSPATAYSTTLTYSSANYDYSRIEDSNHTSSLATGTLSDGTTIYVRYVRQTHTITLTPSYFEPDGNQLDFSIQSSKTESLLDYADFTTSKTFDNCEYKDHTNGIWYVFHRADDVWYSDANCQTPFTNKLRSNTTLYAKMIAYPLTTFYIDADYPGWNNCYLHMWGGSLAGYTSAMNDSLTAKAIATDSGNKLFRISIPTTNVNSFLLHAGHDSGQQTVDLSISSITGSTSKYCRIAGDVGNARTATFTEYKPTSNVTNVWVQKYSGGWTDVVGGQLLPGDGSVNDYILESGLQLTNGDVIRVYDKNTSTVYGYSAYVDSNTSKHTYVATNTVASETAGSSIKIVRLGAASETARFNFYITHDGKISIAMVPDYGNGYYIMKYNSTDKTENFIGATKMDSVEYSASYDGWYCGNTSEKIFIRSYLNAVDSICTSLTSTSLTYVEPMDANYCIEFKETGHYNIRVTGTIVDISEYETDDFFSLNRLDSSLVTGSNTQKQQEIWRQKTAVVVEIPFVANNPFDATVQLKVDCSASWVGVRFAVYSSQQLTPYEMLHGNTNSLYTDSYLIDASLSAPISDSNSLTINANSSGTYYAYVLIDYRYTVTSSNLKGSNPEIGLYLQIVQN